MEEVSYENVSEKSEIGSRNDRRTYFRERGSNETIIEARNQELIENTRWTSIVYKVISAGLPRILEVTNL